jgi:predicted Ser/Thr protein kinase
MEDAIEQIVSYLKHAAQGWKRRNRFCICWGPWAAVNHRLPNA